MHCQEVSQQLSLYLDNMLEGEELLQIQKHIQQCTQCQQELEELKMTMELLKGMEEITPPPSFRKEIINRLAQDEANHPNSETQDETTQRTFDLKAYKEKFKKITTHNMFLGTAIAACIMLVVFSFKYVQFNNFSGGLHSYADTSYSPSENVSDQPGGTEAWVAAGSAPSEPLPEAKAETYGFNPNTAKVSESKDLRTYDSAKKKAGLEAGNIQRKVIKNANIDMETKDFNKTINALDEIVEKQQGYYEKKEINTMGDKAGSFIIKIPADTMSGVMKEFEKIGNVLNTTISSSDVTNDYYDTETRIGVLQKQEQKLLEILKRAKNVEEILKVEEQLVRIREQIETNQGHLKVLNNSIEMSTLNIELHQVQEITKVQQPTGINGTFILAQDAFKFSLQLLIGMIKATVIFLVGAIPFIVIIAIIGGGYFYYRKKRRKEE